MNHKHTKGNSALQSQQQHAAVEKLTSHNCQHYWLDYTKQIMQQIVWVQMSIKMSIKF